jgi:hypothetical protein
VSSHSDDALLDDIEGHVDADVETDVIQGDSPLLVDAPHDDANGDSLGSRSSSSSSSSSTGSRRSSDSVRQDAAAAQQQTAATPAAATSNSSSGNEYPSDFAEH